MKRNVEGPNILRHSNNKIHTKCRKVRYYRVVTIISITIGFIFIESRTPFRSYIVLQIIAYNSFLLFFFFFGECRKNVSYPFFKLCVCVHVCCETLFFNFFRSFLLYHIFVFYFLLFVNQCIKLYRMQYKTRKYCRYLFVYACCSILS